MDNISPIPSLYSKELEQNLLGAILINPTCLDTLDIEPRAFYIQVYSELYRVLRSLHEKNQPIDITTISDEISRRAINIDIAEIAGIINNTTNSFHVESYAERIKEYAKRRRILERASDLARAAVDTDSNLEESISFVLDDIASGDGGSGGAEHWIGAVEDVYRDIDNNREKFLAGEINKIDGIPTGYDDYDAVTGGIHDGELIFIAGEPAVGKSVAAHKMAFNIASLPGIYSIIYSLEMQRKQVARRLLSAWSGIEVAKMRLGNLTENDIIKLPLMVSDAVDIPLYICDRTQVTLDYIQSDIARIKAKNRDKKLGLVLIDYALLVDAPGKDETERSAYVSRKAKVLTSTAPIMLIESVTKAGMDGGSVQKSAMRGSGQQFHDADTIMYILNHIPPRGEEADPNLVTCVFTKVREPLSDTRVFNLRRGSGVPNFYPVSNYLNANERDENEVF